MKQRKNNIPLVLGGIMISIFISSLDNTITGTAMPKIINELKRMDLYSWPFTIYMLCSTIAIPILGKISDSHGRRLAFGFGIITFILASLLCGLSANMLQLIIFRGIQGIGGGTLIANSFIVVADMFAPAERPKYMGLLASVIGLSSISGPVLGGIITDSIGWRWIFLINVPLGIIALIIVMVSLPERMEKPGERLLDIGGIIFFILGISPIILELNWAGRYFKWLSLQSALMGLFSIIMFAVFWKIEKNASDPIIPLQAFKNPVLSISAICAFMINSVSFGSIMLIPLFLQGAKGVSPTQSGAYITPMMLSLLVTSITTGFLITKTGKYKLLAVAAYIITFIGMLMLMGMNSGTRPGQLIVNMIVLGIGIGITLPVFDIASQNAFPHSQVGFVTAILQFSRNVGGSIGSVLFGAIMSASIKDSLMKSSTETGAMIGSSMNLSAVDSGMDSLKQINPGLAGDIISQSIHKAFSTGAIIIFLALITVLFLKENPLRKSNTEDKFERTFEKVDLKESV